MKYAGLFLAIAAIILLAGCRSNEAAIAARQSLRNSQTPFSQSALIEAINNGDKEKVSLFLTAEIDTGIGQHNTNPLIVAVEKNQMEIVKILLDHGVDVDPDGFNGTPLCTAAAKGYDDIVKLLIAKRANLNYLRNSLNPLLLSSAAGHTAVAETLLDAGADINIQSESTLYTALMFAAENGHADAVKLLLAKKADIERLSRGRRSALVVAAFKGHSDIAKLIIESSTYDPKKDSCEALAMSISMDRMDIAREIIKKGADINIQYGSMPLLSWAIKNNYTSGAELLIESGADKQKTDSLSMLPLDYAIEAKNEKIIKMLSASSPPLLD